MSIFVAHKTHIIMTYIIHIRYISQLHKSYELYNSYEYMYLTIL